MAGKKREYADDDGRTIADMSGVERPSLWGVRPPEERTKPPASPPAPPEEDRPWEDASMGPEERRMYVLGALKAGLLIALVFIVALGLLTAFLLFLWT